MFIALDDNNRTGADINPNNSFIAGMENGIACDNVYQAASATQSATLHQKIWQFTGLVHIIDTETPSQPTYTYAPNLVPAVDYPLGLPASFDLEESIFRVEMAELQLFTGVMIDTGEESNRRAFIDADGKPVLPELTPDDPSNPASEFHTPAERLLGKKADVTLHGSNSWINGVNTGPPFVRDPTSPDPSNPRMIPDPNFALMPTGKIITFSPDPALDRPTPPPALLSGELLRQRRMMAV
jgi:hypothetical protein